MSRSAIANSLEELAAAMNTPGNKTISITPQLAATSDFMSVGLSPVFADKAGRLWAVAFDPPTLTLIGEWKRG